jgi:hypothetical protein
LSALDMSTSVGIVMHLFPRYVPLALNDDDT